MQISKQIKPLSVNDAWKGRRFKTEEYKAYEKQLLLTLPRLKIPPPPYQIYFEFGFSSCASDWDNPIKPLQDILCTKYGFKDKDIYDAIIRKRIVAKGEDYFFVEIKTLSETFDS